MRRKPFILTTLLLLLVPIISFTGIAEANVFSACDEARVRDSTLCKEVETAPDPFFGPSGLFADILGIITILVGIAAVIMIIVGGFQYITSAGDPARVSSAKNTLLYAVIGIVVVLFAQAIVQFVIRRV